MCNALDVIVGIAFLYPITYLIRYTGTNHTELYRVKDRYYPVVAQRCVRYSGNRRFFYFSVVTFSFMKTVMRAIVGSQAYGTSTPSSDIDYKGIYAQPTEDLIGFNYKEQIENGKDDTMYEIRRFLQLAQSANPTVLELMYSPKDCIIERSTSYYILLRDRDKFLTKGCANSFGGYAIAQIKKARGLDKKMNWENSRIERKDVLDFCYVYEEGKTLPLKKYLNREGLQQEHCGLVALQHMKDCYALYYDYSAKFANARGKMADLKFKGIVGEGSNEVRLSSVPKDILPLTVMYWNKDGYSMHCRDYAQYQQWLTERNEQRFVDTQHGQKIDGKNMMHCRRLLDMALEIATEGTIHVRRPNAEELLKIRRGEVPLDQILDRAEEDVAKLNSIFDKSGLPDDVDKIFVNNLLLEIRKEINL